MFVVCFPGCTFITLLLTCHCRSHSLWQWHIRRRNKESRRLLSGMKGLPRGKSVDRACDLRKSTLGGDTIFALWSALDEYTTIYKIKKLYWTTHEYTYFKCIAHNMRLPNSYLHIQIKIHVTQFWINWYDMSLLKILAKIKEERVTHVNESGGHKKWWFVNASVFFIFNKIFLDGKRATTAGSERGFFYFFRIWVWRRR